VLVEVAAATEVVPEARRARPDVPFWTVEMPRPGRISATQALRASLPIVPGAGVTTFGGPVTCGARWPPGRGFVVRTPRPGSCRRHQPGRLGRRGGRSILAAKTLSAGDSTSHSPVDRRAADRRGEKQNGGRVADKIAAALHLFQGTSATTCPRDRKTVAPHPREAVSGQRRNGCSSP